MKKLSKLSILLVMVAITMACNLSQFLSDKISSIEKTPTPAAGNNSVFEEEMQSCIPSSTLSSDYSPVDVNIIKESEQLDQITSLVKNIFQGAKISKYDTYVNKDKTKVMSCVYLSPISALEKTSFDLVLKNPDTFFQLIKIPELTIENSSLTNEFDEIGENRILFHVSFGNENPKSAEIVAIRFNDTVAIYSFIYTDSSDDLGDFRNVLGTLQ